MCVCAERIDGTAVDWDDDGDDDDDDDADDADDDSDAQHVHIDMWRTHKPTTTTPIRCNRLKTTRARPIGLGADPQDAHSDVGVDDNGAMGV